MGGLRAGATGLSLGLALAMASAGTHAATSSARITLSTYLRAGPGETYQALDELEHDTPVQVLGCGEAWCRVVEGAASGYVDKAALALPLSPPPAGRKARPDCFVTGQLDYHGQIPTRFCGGPAG